MEIVQKIWPADQPALHLGMVQLLMQQSHGRPIELITHIESFNPYD